MSERYFGGNVMKNFVENNTFMLIAAIIERLPP